MSADPREARIGLGFGFACYGLWGLGPIVWKAVDHVPMLEIVAQRALWSIPFLIGLLAAFGAWGELRASLRDNRTLRLLLLTTGLLTINWGAYVYGVASGQILAVSLGYFLNPLVNVALGIVFLRERLRPAQLLAVGIAAAGVAHLALQLGEVPWIALALAFSFAFYGLLRKTMAAGALVGLTIETSLVLPIALGFLMWQAAVGTSVSMAAPATDWLLFAATGAATVFPLYWFTQAAKRLRYSTIGVLQYLAPSLQFGLAVLVYGEAFTAVHMITFGAIWLALAVYTADSLRAWRRAGARRVGAVTPRGPREAG